MAVSDKKLHDTLGLLIMLRNARGEVIIVPEPLPSPAAVEAGGGMLLFADAEYIYARDANGAFLLANSGPLGHLRLDLAPVDANQIDAVL